MSRPEGLRVVGKNVGAIPAVWERWDAAAAMSRKTRQQWIRDALNAEAVRVEAKTAKAKP